MGKRASPPLSSLGTLWTKHEMANRWRPRAVYNTGHMTEPGALVAPSVLARDFDVAEIQVLLRQALTRASRASVVTTPRQTREFNPQDQVLDIRTR